MELSQERGVRFGIVEHGGRGETIDDDAALKPYIQSLDGQPVYTGIQAEGLDWVRCFSREVVAQLDFVLSDALTFPEPDGRRVRLWTPEVNIEDEQDFMDRYVDFNVSVLSATPIDIMANPTFLPSCIADQYDALWTEDRMKKVIEAAVKNEVAIEINARYSIPSVSFIRIAKNSGVRFSFGSNSHGEDAGKLDYCLEIVKKCGLTREDMFMPKPHHATQS